MEESIIKKRQNESQEDEDELAQKAARKAERLDEENEVVITILSDIKDVPKEKIIYKYSKDISMSGTKIQGNFLLPIDTSLKIELTLKNAKEKVTVFGNVRRNRIVGNGKYYEAGVEFVDTPAEAIKKLGDYIVSINDYRNLNPVGVPYWIFAKFNKPESK